MIEIDGSQGEGGGQVLRSSLTLSLLTGKPFRLFNIRARRSKPGLMPQHLKAVEAAATVGRARVEGAALHAQELHFAPKRVEAGDYRFDIGTAGSAPLVLQTLLLPLSLIESPSRVTVIGGTHVRWSPCFHYLDWHWRHFMDKAGFRFDLDLVQAGFYPRGGGRIDVRVSPAGPLTPLQITERGSLRRISGVSAVARLPWGIAERQRDQAMRRLAGRCGEVDIALTDLPVEGPGTLLLLLAEFEHSQCCYYGLGERGKPAERVADEAVDGLLEFVATDGAVDPYLADQLLLPLSLAEGESRLRSARITQHLMTNAEVVRRFLPVDIRVDGALGQSGTVRIRGVGRDGLEPGR